MSNGAPGSGSYFEVFTPTGGPYGSGCGGDFGPCPPTMTASTTVPVADLSNLTNEVQAIGAFLQQNQGTPSGAAATPAPPSMSGAPGLNPNDLTNLEAALGLGGPSTAGGGPDLSGLLNQTPTAQQVSTPNPVSPIVWLLLLAGAALIGWWVWQHYGKHPHHAPSSGAASHG